LEFGHTLGLEAPFPTIARNMRPIDEEDSA